MMKNISVVIIDDNSDVYSFIHFLEQNGILISAQYGQNEFLMSTKNDQVGKDPDIVIVSFDAPKFLTELTLDFARRQYPSSKILINSVFNDKSSVDKIIRMNIDGVVFKNDNDSEEILQALIALKKGREYFAGGYQLANSPVSKIVVNGNLRTGSNGRVSVSHDRSE